MFFAGASVTLYAILKVANALLLVLGPHPVRLMFVAPVTRKATEVVVDVTCRTGRIVVAVQVKELLVVECGGLPMCRVVASRATVFDLAVQRISGRFVTSLAAIQHCLLEQRMLERGGFPAFRLVALPAIHTEIAVEIVLRRSVAGRAAFARRNAQQ